MPVQVDTPSNVGSPSDWGLWGGGATSKVQAVSSDDGDLSVVYASSGGRLVKDDYIFPILEGVADPVTSAFITTRVRTYLKGGGGRSYFLRWNGGRVGANRQSEVRVKQPKYVTTTYTATGAELVVASVNGEHGMEFSAAGGPSNKGEYWVTHLYRTVDFDYAAGSGEGFAHLVGSLIGLIGGNLAYSHMAGLAKEIYQRRHILIRPDEYETALRAWNARKFPVAA